MNKKKGVLSLISASIIYYSISFASSAWSSFGFYNIQQGPRDLIYIIQNFFAPFFEVILGTSQYEAFFFTKVLFLILLFVIIKYVLEKSQFLGMEDKPGISTIVSAAVSILAIRFIPQTDLVSLVLLPYNVLGIAILTILPFLLFLFFIEQSNMRASSRKIAWILYGVVFGVLWYNRYSDLSPIGNQIYGWMLVAIIAAFLLDPQIRQHFGVHEFDQRRKDQLILQRNNLEEETAKLEKATDKDSQDLAKRNRKRILKITKEISKL